MVIKRVFISKLKQTKTLNPPFVEGGTSEIFALLLDKLLKWLIDSHYLISLVITDNTSNNQRQNCFNWCSSRLCNNNTSSLLNKSCDGRISIWFFFVKVLFYPKNAHSSQNPSISNLQIVTLYFAKCVVVP